ncbi:unnamed protein product [Penicillium salamii]|uniref:Zn(2)-C6 fungal-type domain-containing protein n=1 Tax=Penicillium salamii TaxID=1612424 RepID=A0A9W4J9C7_9EURO|nr:unnamed protein product [Penicillium salamii]CAG8075530.1 unnamed protein product [Penicillium salamii]CAG8175130.1 unnamed protein product [Penicillium salamii]CAG8224795.1 unnamed protein product [Penicillium salamii]CAG8312256.1 unnamed protein product [Penicillium salamii]
MIGSEMPHPCRAPRGLSANATTRGLCNKSLTQRAQLRVLQPGDLPVLCDQQKPVCAKCIRSNRQCGGYRKETVFVLVQPAAERKHTFIRSPSTPSSSPLEIENMEPTKSSLATVAHSNDSPHPFPETSLAYGILHRTMESHNLFQVFISRCFPTHLLPTPQSWIPLLGDLSSRVEALEISTAAIAASAIGHMFHHDYLIKQSLKYYTRGLNQLQRALRDPDIMREDGTLAACMALSLYEALECPNPGPEGYFNHCHGLVALVKARGQHMHSSSVGHRLFLGVRVPGILFALNHQTSNILLESSWMEQPWTELPKTPHDRVTDCLARAPAILQRVQSLISMNPAQQMYSLRDIIGECWHIDEQMESIYNCMRLSKGDALYWPVPSRADHLMNTEGSGNLFPIVFNFQNTQIAATLMLLWATRTMLWSGLTNMYQHLEAIIAAQGHNTNTSAELKNEVNPMERCGDYIFVAHQVCQSVEYFLHDEMLLSGPLSVSPALGIIADSLRNRPGHDQELAWIQGALKLARQKGLRVLEHVRL